MHPLFPPQYCPKSTPKWPLHQRGKTENVTVEVGVLRRVPENRLDPRGMNHRLVYVVKVDSVGIRVIRNRVLSPRSKV